MNWWVDLSLWMSIGFFFSLPRSIRLFINDKCKLSRGILNCKSLISRRLPIFVQSLWLFIYFSRSALACVCNNIGDCQFLCNPNNYSSISHALLLNVLLTSHITTFVKWWMHHGTLEIRISIEILAFQLLKKKLKESREEAKRKALPTNENAEILQLLENQHLFRRLKRTKPFELV